MAASPASPAAPNRGGERGAGYDRQKQRILDQVDQNFLDVKWNVEQLPAEEILKRLHRILHQVGAELLSVFKEFERANDPEQAIPGFA